MLLLKCRCGVDGFFCLARNNTAYELPQDWFFSDPDIDAYFITALDGWDKCAISRSLERFSLSACEYGHVVTTTSRGCLTSSQRPTGMRRG